MFGRDYENSRMSSGTLGSERLPSSNTSNPSNAVLEALLKRRGNGGVNMSRAEYLHQKDRRLVAAQEDVRGALSSALEGVVAFVDGETLPPKEELKSMIIAHGGVFLQTDSSDVTHYICNRLPAAHIRRFQNGKLQHRRVVTVQWLVDSVAAGRKLDEEEFVVPAFRHPSQRALSFRPAQSEWYVSIRARHPGLELAASVRAAFATSAQPLSLVPLGEAELIAAAPVAEADLRSLWLPALGVLGVEGAGGVGRSLPLARLASFANLLGAVKPKDGDYAVWPRDATAEGRLVEARPLSMLLPDLTGADLSALSRAHVRTCGELVASIDRGGAACQLLGERANFIRALAASTEPLAPQCSDSVGEPQPREPREPLEQPTRKESEAELQALAVDGWRCPECTLINPAQYLQCDACCTHIPTESARGGGSSSASAISSRPTAVQDGIGNGKDSPLKRKSVKASPPKRNGRAKKAKKAKGSPPAQRKSPFHAPMGGSPEERRMREGRAPVSPIEIDMDDVDPYPSTSTVPATRAGEDSWPDLEPVLSEWLRLEPTPRAEPLLDAAESLFENMRAEDVKLMVLLLERECLPRREWHSSLREFVRRVDELSRKRYGGCFKPSEHIRHSLQSLEA